MELTTAQRRARIEEILAADPELQLLMEEYHREQRRLERYDWLPRPIRSRLWACPTLAHLIRGKMLDILSKEMRLPRQ